MLLIFIYWCGGITASHPAWHPTAFKQQGLTNFSGKVDRFVKQYVILSQGKRFDWSRNDCDVGFLYDMYYACAIKDVEQRRKRVHRSVNELDQKSTNRETKVIENKESSTEVDVEIDKEIAEKIRKTAARLIQHDTAAIIQDLKKEVDKREETGEGNKRNGDLKKEVETEMSKKEESRKMKREKVQHEVKKFLSVDHESETKHHRKMKKITAKSATKKKFNEKKKKTTDESEDRLKLISSKYHEMEKVLVELKGMIESEQDRLTGMHEVGNNHLVKVEKHSHHENAGVKEAKNSANVSKGKTKSKVDEGQNKTGNVHKIKMFKKNTYKANKIAKVKSIDNHVEEQKRNIKTAEEERKRVSSFQENEPSSEGKSFFQRCKLAAYLYFISIRGFGEKFYLKKSPEWCEKGCVKAKGGIHFKTLRRPRSIV